MFNATRLLYLSAIIALSLSTPAIAAQSQKYRLVGLEGCNSSGACGQLFTDAVLETIPLSYDIDGCKEYAKTLRNDWESRHNELESYKVWCAGTTTNTGYVGKL